MVFSFYFSQTFTTCFFCEVLLLLITAAVERYGKPSQSKKHIFHLLNTETDVLVVSKNRWITQLWCGNMLVN